MKLKIKKQKSMKPKPGSLTTAKSLAKMPKSKRQKTQIRHTSGHRRHKPGMKAGISLQMSEALKVNKVVIL